MDIIWAGLLLFVAAALAQDSDCDFYQKVAATDQFTIRQPNYPGKYKGGLQCRWVADCPSGYNCRLDCPFIDMPASASCMNDRLLISKTGDLLLTGADTYCGRGSLSAVSTGQRISIGLITSKSTSGGEFRCDLTAQPATPNKNCVCGVRRQNRIVNGVETGINEFPMMVGLADVGRSKIKCGATIISEDYVVTAAHCVMNENLKSLAVIVGEHDVTTGNETSAAKGYAIAQYIIHPGYTTSNYDNDIALIKVATPIQFNDRVSPVCLPFKFRSYSFAGKNVTILGWGTLEPGGPDSKVLRKVDVGVMSQTQCRYQVPTLTDRQICTFTRGKDSCQDDSGGPLLYTDPDTGLLHLAALVSYGLDFCASALSPAVNTRITSHLDWIVANTKGNYCYK
ncbi:venom serine protease-like isoform X2 [Anticarsia gemmatalis]